MIIRKTMAMLVLFGLLFVGSVSAQTVNVGGSSDANVDIEVGSDTSTEVREEAEAEAKAEAEADLVGISVEAREIENLDAEARAEFLTQVKTQTEVRSEQDLENFAKGVVVSDGNVQAVESSESRVSVTYRVPAKLFGFINASVPVRVEVRTEAEGDVGAENQSRVEVDMPWYRFLFDIPEGLKKAELQASAESRVSAVIDGRSEFNAGRQAQILSEVRAEFEERVDLSLEADADEESEEEN